MSQKIWQVNFKFSVTPEQYSDAVAPLADPISEVPGLLWKVWIVNPEESESGGIHLFADQASLDAYAASDIVNGILSNPALSDFSVKTFEVMEEYSHKTRAPVGDAIPA
ncbi:MAG: YdhR family protein [Chloroflexota bacterium]|nr:MAG: YdhR family protein [Chloroflexota bacterium]